MAQPSAPDPHQDVLIPELESSILKGQPEHSSKQEKEHRKEKLCAPQRPLSLTHGTAVLTSTEGEQQWANHTPQNNYLASYGNGGEWNLHIIYSIFVPFL